MPFQLTNQQPQTFYTTKPSLPLIDLDLDPDEYYQHLKAHTFEVLVRPLYTPTPGSKNVEIKDSVSQSTIDPRTFTEALLHYLRTDIIDQDLTDDLLSLYKQGSQHNLDSSLSFDQFLVLEALSTMSLPYPNKGSVIYTPGEVVSAADTLYSELNKVNPVNIHQLKTDWFARLGAYVSQFHLSNFRLVTVKDSQTFEDLQANVRAYLKTNITLPQDTARHLTQFNNLSIDGELSLGLFLPHELKDDEYSFNRILERAMAEMERRPNQRLFNELYSLKGALRPTKLIILNLDEYRNARNLQKEWQQIVNAFNNVHKIQHIKNQNLQTLQATTRNLTPPPTYDGGDIGYGAAAERSDKIDYMTAKQMDTRSLLKRLSDIVKRQTSRQPTSNHRKKESNTFMRANRRNPDDINAQGKSHTTMYHPDIHVWLDTSASISREDYEKEMQVMIAIAKHMNVDLYFNSFSHIVSETTKVPTQNQTPQQIFKMIENIDKVAGGTNFVNVWKAIDKTESVNIKAGFAPRVHVIASDMDFNIPTTYALQTHRPSVKNTYYVPIRIQSDRDRLHIASFAKGLETQGGKGLSTGHILF